MVQIPKAYRYFTTSSIVGLGEFVEKGCYDRSHLCMLSGQQDNHLFTYFAINMRLVTVKHQQFLMNEYNPTTHRYKFESEKFSNTIHHFVSSCNTTIVIHAPWDLSMGVIDAGAGVGMYSSLFNLFYFYLNHRNQFNNIRYAASNTL